MAYNIEELKDVINRGGGLAMANMYRVEFLAQNQAKNIDTLCKAVNMPGRQILTNERIVGTNRYVVAYGFEKEQVTMTFNITNDSYIRYFFEEWLNLVVTNDSYEVGYYSDYVKNIQVKQLRKSVDIETLNTLRSPKKTYTSDNADISAGSQRTSFNVPDDTAYTCLLEDAYPVSITGVGYADANNDTPVEISVTFAYKNWRSINNESVVSERSQQQRALQSTKVGP